jgi:type IV pilus assembly protein PilP
MRMRRWGSRRVVAASLALGLAGMAGAPPAQAAQKVAASATLRQEDPQYDPHGLRDPFRPPSADAAANDELTPLQRYQLGQLKLVAVIYDTRFPRAVVEDEAGLGYILQVGTPIGPNNGAVKAIEPGRVVVREETTDFYGEPQAAEVIIELASGEERGT